MWLAPLLALAACATGAKTQAADNRSWPTLDGKPPLVIAHRGASGYLPEHTLEAYGLAIEQGADVIEPDLVFTKDGVLVARHDRYLSTTTDVADHPEFAERKKPNADPDGAPRDDWWVEDFTLAELKTLRAVQPFPGRSKDYDGLYEIPTFAEVLAFVSTRAKEAGRSVGVYPETKHLGYFQSIGMDFEQPLLAALESFDAGPVFIQSFEADILKRLKGKTDAKLVQLVYEETPGAGPNIPLSEVAEYADGVGPTKDLIRPSFGETTSLVADAHGLGLAVHPWTFRLDQPNRNVGTLLGLIIELPEENTKNTPALTTEGDKTEFAQQETIDDMLFRAEFEFFFDEGVDGLFTDFPDAAVKARSEIRPGASITPELAPAPRIA
jgi:glycerophosphoryl diester phosphodiesterase